MCQRGNWKTEVGGKQGILRWVAVGTKQPQEEQAGSCIKQVKIECLRSLIEETNVSHFSRELYSPELICSITIEQSSVHRELT